MKRFIALGLAGILAGCAGPKIQSINKLPDDKVKVANIILKDFDPKTATQKPNIFGNVSQSSPGFSSYEVVQRSKWHKFSTKESYAHYVHECMKEKGIENTVIYYNGNVPTSYPAKTMIPGAWNIVLYPNKIDVEIEKKYGSVYSYNMHFAMALMRKDGKELAAKWDFVGREISYGPTKDREAVPCENIVKALREEKFID